MKIVMEKAEGFDDWYLIVKAEHDGRVWLEKTGPNSSRFMMSERISDACVEGGEEEMVCIAEGIKARECRRFTRCAVAFHPDGVHFWSPRNSKEDGVVTVEEADELADQILMYFTNDEEGKK
jgi:hypothetical protein